MYFREVECGNKKFELRKNDRDYLIGDYLLLREWDFNGYTGRAILTRITYMLQIEALIKTKEPWVILSISCLRYFQRYEPHKKSGEKQPTLFN